VRCAVECISLNKRRNEDILEEHTVDPFERKLAQY
jgi:hypothetical protein